METSPPTSMKSRSSIVPNPGQDLTYVAQVAPGVVMNTQAGGGNFSSFGSTWLLQYVHHQRHGLSELLWR